MRAFTRLTRPHSASLAVLLLIGAGRPAAHAQQHTLDARSLVFDGVTVVDVVQGKLVSGQRVVITGNRIRAMDNAGAVRIPEGAQVVDARGKYLIPGLWDMHFHTTNDVQYLSLIANGVTGIRDATMFVATDTFLQWRREILAGTKVGPPRQLLSVRINNADSCEQPAEGRRKPTNDIRKGVLCVNIGDTADVRRKVTLIKSSSADMIKMYRLSDAMYFAVAAEARRIDLPFGGHAPAEGVGASDSGARFIDHLTYPRVGWSTRCVVNNTASIEACQPIADRFARNGTWWVPTMFVGPHSMGGELALALYARCLEFVKAFLADSVSYGDFRKYLRRAVNGDLSRPPVPYEDLVHQSPPSGGTTPDTAGYLYVVRNTGLPVVAGTDGGSIGGHLPSGFSLQTELAMYVAEGVTPLEALQTATLNPAKSLHGTDSLGTVAPGKLADLVLLDADPLVDITNTTAIRAVVANGRYFDRTALDSLLTEVRQRKDEEEP